MTISLAGVLADARALWRSERELLLPIAGMFFFVPMLGIVLLLAYSGFTQVAPEKLREAVSVFYAENLLLILLANVMIEFGTFAVLNLLLKGEGSALGQVLLRTLRRFLPFFGISLIGGLLFSIGLSLFIVPGLFAFGRTWLVGPSYAAAPEAGPIDAFRQGWRRSGGLGWVTLLAAVGVTMIAAILMIVISTVIISGLAAIFGDRPMLVVSLLVTALIGGFTWTALAVLRVAAYRRSEPRQGM